MDSSMYRTRNVYLRCIAAIYLSAFSSFYLQIRGLWGPNGVLPSHTRLNFQDTRSFYDIFWENPTLLHLAHIFGLTVSYCMELFALSGILLSFLGLVYQKVCNTLTFFILWILYLSLYQVGQTFLHFQWDTMLLECGFITILVAPIIHFKKGVTLPKDRLCFWLVKWLLFRLMFAAGIVKLTSKCPTWWGLTALTVHFESQCIPTPLAWYFHQFPIWFNKLSVVATLVIEIGLPFLFFAPFRKLRLISCYGQLLLQLMIIASGNYNFFNFLTSIFCLSLVDDNHVFGKSGSPKVQKSGSSEVQNPEDKSFKLEDLFVFVFVALLIYELRLWFGIDFGKGDLVYSEIKFSYEDFDAALKWAVPTSIVLGAISFVITASSSLYDLTFKTKSSLGTYILSVMHFVPYFVLATFLFGISLVPFSTLERTTQATLPAFVNRWHGQFNQFHLTSSYGLFRSMTGVGGRPEVVLEGAAKLDGPWTEIPFKYKPGAVDRPAPFVAPHQPRLDWQMWFAALGNYHQNPWLTSLVYRLLTNQSEVINLLDSNVYNEFEDDWPPKYIKGSLYIYHYTTPNDSVKNDWWKRTRDSDYLPTFTANHKPLIDYLVKHKILDHPDIPLKNNFLASILDGIWVLCSASEPHIFIWGLLLSALVIVRLK